MTRTRTVSREEARSFLVSHLGLARFDEERGLAGIRATLDRLRCIQLDPLDVVGTNADLVVIARVLGARRGDIHRALYPGHAFEHFAKERCLLPARAFPYYRDQAVETPWWRHSERMKRLDPTLLGAVLDEVERRGPISARTLEHRGTVEPMDWSGWKGTKSAAKLALEVLWTRCKIVVAGRARRDKLYDVPGRALPGVARAVPEQEFERWALVERAHAAGLLSRAGGPHWSMLASVRTSDLPQRLVAEGVLEEIVIEGSRRSYLAPAGLLEAPHQRPDDAMRILGPLDPILWDRSLVRDAFGFDYVWEVYKPAAERRYGWYVCPLYHRGRLVGRIEAAVAGATLAVEKIWREEARSFDEDALDRALERHADACGCDAVRRSSRARRRPAGRAT
jgi:hypothetical protein